jgi:15,16-dihydrobiliverdin:ferredoxin oxidoreductase
MNKYILADMVTEKLKKEIGMVAKPLPDKLRIMEGELPSGRVCFDNALYQADKVKKITIGNHTIGEVGAGSLIMIVADDEYDLPFIVVDIAFDSGAKGEIFTEFEAKPLVKDEESTRKYVEPFQKWRQELDKLPGEPPSGAGEVGEFLKANMSPNEYLRLIPSEYADEVLKFADQFFDIFIDIYQNAEPVKDTERRRKMQAFRKEYNKHVLEEDPSGVMLMNVFGRETAELFYDYLLYL